MSHSLPKTTAIRQAIKNNAASALVDLKTISKNNGNQSSDVATDSKGFGHRVSTRQLLLPI
ncbi:hypothetical protein [uncultured Duncaniella sp.]|uniref:hypothetical protein n=1 Tax=uncultured Duncaniella sp. TaxID=2768039 RepID=UPI0025AA06A2|nr:hypothetical protein [uncultured Duncaniella sp.]